MNKQSDFTGWSLRVRELHWGILHDLYIRKVAVCPHPFNTVPPPSTVCAEAHRFGSFRKFEIQNPVPGG